MYPARPAAQSVATFPTHPAVQMLSHDLASSCDFPAAGLSGSVFFTDRVNLFWAHHGGVLFWSVMLH